MGARNSSSQDDMITDINVTPFVDVMLVLLIMFMIAAPVVYQSALKVKLPNSTQATAFEHITLRLFLNEGGQLFLDKRPITAAEIPILVQSARKKDPNADALVAADREVHHGKVIEVIDALRAGGLAQVGIGVESPTKK